MPERLGVQSQRSSRPAGAVQTSAPCGSTRTSATRLPAASNSNAHSPPPGASTGELAPLVDVHVRPSSERRSRTVRARPRRSYSSLPS